MTNGERNTGKCIWTLKAKINTDIFDMSMNRTVPYYVSKIILLLLAKFEYFITIIVLIYLLTLLLSSQLLF